VVGYISFGRGITVHRRDCLELQRLSDTHPERLIDVTWTEIADNFYPVEISIRSHDRHGLLRDITNVLANEHVNVTAVNTQSHRSDGTASMLLTVEIANLATLGSVLTRIQQIPSVIEAKRSHQVRAS
jgi:GTP pyrophosphokinase